MTDPNQRDPGHLIVVVDGQFGSCGKGHLAAQLGKMLKPGSLVIRTGGPNAGHTVWENGIEYKLRHLPTPLAQRNDLHYALAARSVVDPNVLRDELSMFPNQTIVVDPAATILEPEHIATETDSDRMRAIGSTRKGIGAARADRIARTARTARDEWGGYHSDTQVITLEVAPIAYSTLRIGADVLIEAAQGYGLGLHTPYYPYTTSADCTAIDALADTRISPWAIRGLQPEVWMAMRPYPIRVAGTSGPLYRETSWFELNLPEERTTVTNKVRRVGHWDPELAKAAAFANGVPKVALMMVDQVVPEIRGMTTREGLTAAMRSDDPAGKRLRELVSQVADDTGCQVAAIGTGPETMVFA